MTTTAKKKEEVKDDALVLYIGSERVPLATPEALLTKAQLDLLASRTPEKYVKKRQGRGGKTFDYVEVNYVIGILNATFGFDWSITVLDKIIDTKSGNVIVLIRLSVNFANGKTITKDAFGGSDIKLTKQGAIIDIADDLKAAQSDAIKKAASMLGVAWDVYSGMTKDDGNGDSQAGNGDALDAEFENMVTRAEDAPDPKDGFRNIQLIGADGKKRIVTKFEAYQEFKKLKEEIGHENYYEMLGAHGYSKCNEIPDKMLAAIFAILVKFRHDTKEMRNPGEDMDEQFK